MYLLYSLLVTLGVCAYLPVLVYRFFRHPAYLEAITRRFGKLPDLRAGLNPVVWVHCVSVGETQAARPLIEAIVARYPSVVLVVSSITPTGQALAGHLFGSVASAITYLPFDWSWSVRRVLKKANPRLVLIMETEIWPNFLRRCKERGCFVALMNGRLSESSFRGYMRVRWFVSRVLNCFDLAAMQTEADAGRISKLGLLPDRIQVSGNLKFDIGTTRKEELLTDQLRTQFHSSGLRPLIIAASTHDPEEEIILKAFRHIVQSGECGRPRLLLAPRRPERFAAVASLLQKTGLNWVRRTSSSDSPDFDIILMDTVGELRAVYPLAEIVFVGGSIAPVGGHNLLEPAESGKCIITGPHTYNFAAITRTLAENQALIQLPEIMAVEEPKIIAKLLMELLRDRERRMGMGKRAQDVCTMNRGATERTMAMLQPFFEGLISTS